ncbi:integral membrane protein (rarD protein) [Arthrobacter crystallopoietes BAB-32]|uniref:Integral membrane protein (RarD protein) n=1 Tax=Arthrobacter crystallopoietes BAB-32 TaxID=1246476 RepID=N1UT35_9MICC|nr:EamA family transporter RarD [Arthrobacter crystallopoietes]EMY32215.1 integral membrane protein (rarD protein) [Arthrobacter crystallopoietes BAB-32]
MGVVPNNDGVSASLPDVQPPAVATEATASGTGAQGRRGRRPRSENSAGLAFGLAAYGIWGILPLYFAVLDPAGPLEIVANRIVWSLLFCLLLMTAMRSWRPFLAAMRSGRILGVLTLAAALIAVNWFTYTVAVLSERTVEASLGYFINPLVSVLLGVLLLKERLRPAQWAALGVAFAAVLVLAFGYGNVPWLSLVLALSFGFYGLVKKNVGSKVDAVSSLSVETLVLTPLSIAIMAVLMVQGQATLTDHGAGHFWLMAAGGLITALPLLFFGAAARRLPLSTVGMLQYLAPLLQFITALAVFHEPMPPERWAGFALVWLSLAILTADMVLAYRKAPRPAA